MCERNKKIEVGDGIQKTDIENEETILELCVYFFRGVSGAIVVLHSSLLSFVASTRLIRSRVGAIDSPGQSGQGFEQYDTSEVLEKVFQSTF